ncbi:MAG TPA: hypothetical protein VFE58_11525, partial [Tepidisphaeraceae bacterium]|nr:hypothetical protein [Tepidisphaeraceae bacterium]
MRSIGANPRESISRKHSNSLLTLSTTPPQSPATSCLNNRALPYHAESSLDNPHLQSGTFANITHTGTPIPPAKCATAVS